MIANHIRLSDPNRYASILSPPCDTGFGTAELLVTQGSSSSNEGPVKKLDLMIKNALQVIDYRRCRSGEDGYHEMVVGSPIQMVSVPVPGRMHSALRLSSFTFSLLLSQTIKFLTSNTTPKQVQQCVSLPLFCRSWRQAPRPLFSRQHASPPTTRLSTKWTITSN